MKNVEEWDSPAVEALVKAARELTDLHYAAFRTDDGSGDGITVIDSDAEYCEHFPMWVNMAVALKPWWDSNLITGGKFPPITKE